MCIRDSYYGQPTQKEYYKIVCELAKKQGLELADDFLCAEARKWELHHGGISGRTAQQFICLLYTSRCV